MTKLKPKALRQGAKGFTLIEMAIVLVIIGLILASVMKGKDMIRSSQAKEFVEGFVYKWVNMVQTYRDKAFQVLTDGKLNGGVNATNDGYMDNVYPQASSSDTAPSGWEGVSGLDIVKAMQNHGVDPCRMIKSDVVSTSTSAVTYCNGMDIFRRTVKGEDRVSDTKVYFTNLHDVTLADGTHYVRKNALVFPNIPVDVAKAIDKQLDGRPDGQSGICLALSQAEDSKTNLASSTIISAAATAKAWGDVADQQAGKVQTVAIILEQ